MTTVKVKKLQLLLGNAVALMEVITKVVGGPSLLSKKRMDQNQFLLREAPPLTKEIKIIVKLVSVKLQMATNGPDQVVSRTLSQIKATTCTALEPVSTKVQMLEL